MAETNEIISIPAFLAPEDTTVSLMSEGDLCGEGGCCTTECSQYCMSSQGGDCGEDCGETCTNQTCTSQTCEAQTCENQSPPPSATINFSATGSTSNSISVAVTGMDPTYESIRSFEWFLDGSLVGGSTTSPYATSAYFMYSGLSSNTWYHLDVKIYNETKTTLLVSLYTDAATQPGALNEWHWTTEELDAFNNHGSFSVLTATRWNDFCDRINETCIAAGSSWTPEYTTLAGTKASSSGVPLTALMFNSARFNIGSRESTGIEEVSTGNTIYGWYFVTLQDKLNIWIGRL